MSTTLASRVDLGSVATEVRRRAGSGAELPVYAVTKHRGFVPSLEYFKKQVFSRDTKGYRELRTGEIAYATIHLDEGSVGVCPEPCLVSPMYTGFRVDRTRVLPEFLLRFLKSPEALARYALMGRGSVHRRKAIPFSGLATLPIPLPPLSEQERVAAILDAADDLRAKRRESLDQLNALLVSTFHDVFGDTAADPTLWPRTTLGELADRVTKGTTPTTYGMEFVESGVPFIRVQNLVDGRVAANHGTLFIDDTTHETLKRSQIRQGDLLLSIAGTIGRAAVVDFAMPMNCNQAVAIVRLSAELGRAYLLHWFATDDALRQISGGGVTGTITNLSLASVKSLRVPIPPLELQCRFATIVESIEKQKDLMRAHLAELDTLFGSLQQRAFNGEL